MATDLTIALEALADSERALDQLEATCCVPDRSPSMEALAATLARARASLTDAEESATVTAHLEDAGAQVGRLQVGCCAPSRLPLYARILENLTTAQRSLGSMH